MVVGLEQLLDLLSAHLCEAFAAEAVYILMLEPITRRYHCLRAKGPGVRVEPEANFGQTDRLIKWLGVNKTVLDVDADPGVIAYLAEAETQTLRSLNVALVVPFVAVNRLTGVALLSRLPSARRFSAHEKATLLTVAAHSALALENSMLYQFQEERLRKLFHADKLASLGELAAGAAHEIRNPLTSIRSTVQYLKKDLSESRQPLVDGIIEEVDRIDGIIQGLLSLGRTAEIHATTVDLPGLVHSLLALLESEFRGQAIDIIEEKRVERGLIEGDPAQLKQVLLNVLLNSMQAMAGRGGIIRITMEELGQESTEGKMISLSIVDTGPGIAPDHLPRVFDPFFTTKANGTGLGLSIAYGIVSRHGGTIHIRSTQEGDDHGTTTVIRLPKRIDKGGGES
jgi:signal transduction histidine kinase